MKKIYLLVAFAVIAAANAMAQKVAMLQLPDASTTEQTALDWFKGNVTDGEVITVEDLANLTTDKFSALWIMVDRVGLAAGAENLPDGLNRIAKTKVKEFVQVGGNLLLSNQATQVVNSIGRCSYVPGIYGSGAGGNNPDEWGIQAVIGNVEGQTYDHRSHAIFTDLEENESYGHPTFALIGAGMKYDHNCMWDLNAYSDIIENPNKVADFENKTNSTILGTWQHVVDYCCAGVVEFSPTTEFAGKVLAVGIAAFDWGQSEYNLNFTQFASNLINYVAEGTTTTIVNLKSDSSKTTAAYNIAGQRIADNAKGLVIKNGKAVIIK